MNCFVLGVKIICCNLTYPISWSGARFMTVFVTPTGPFWMYFGVMLVLKLVLEAPFWSEVDLTTSTHPILDGFGTLMGRFLEIFWYLLSM